MQLYCVILHVVKSGVKSLQVICHLISQHHGFLQLRQQVQVALVTTDYCTLLLMMMKVFGIIMIIAAAAAACVVNEVSDLLCCPLTALLDIKLSLGKDTQGWYAGYRMQRCIAVVNLCTEHARELLDVRNGKRERRRTRHYFTCC